jgi:hypothetical protein
LVVHSFGRLPSLPEFPGEGPAGELPSEKLCLDSLSSFVTLLFEFGLCTPASCKNPVLANDLTLADNSGACAWAGEAEFGVPEFDLLLVTGVGDLSGNGETLAIEGEVCGREVGCCS